MVSFLEELVLPLGNSTEVMITDIHVRRNVF